MMHRGREFYCTSDALYVIGTILLLFHAQSCRRMPPESTNMNTFLWSFIVVSNRHGTVQQTADVNNWSRVPPCSFNALPSITTGFFVFVFKINTNLRIHAHVHIRSHSKICYKWLWICSLHSSRFR